LTAVNPQLYVDARVIPVGDRRNVTTKEPTRWPRWWEITVLVAIGTLLLFGLVAYYDNAHRATTNGLWKSIYVAMWAEGLPGRVTEGGNLLYYQAIGVAVRALPAPVFGTVWQRMAYVNAIAGALTLAVTYAIALRLFASRAAAVFTVFFQASTGFFLLLSTINEDVMPAFFWFEAAFASAILPRRWTTAMTLVSAQLVALTWLFHSSFQLPAIAAFALGLLVRQQSFAAGVRDAILFVASTIPLPLLAAVAYRDYGVDYWWLGLWSGKGLGTGWGGFSAAKIILLFSGVYESVVGGANVAKLSDILKWPHVMWVAVTWVGVLLALVVLAIEAWRHWSRPEWRFAAVAFVGSFVLAEGMNLFAQPQDPQMQLQPMVWLPFAVGALFWITGRHAAAWLRVSARLVMVAAVIVLLVANVTAYSPSRHQDSIALANVKMVESFTRPGQTMFLVHGFEPLTTWLAATWGRGALWPDKPQPVEHARRFHAIFIVDEATQFPSRSPQDAANDIVRFVWRALDEGFTVVSTDIWAADEAVWTAQFMTVSGPEKPKAIRAALQENFDGVAIGTAGSWGTLYQLKRRTK
jgi:hypothetical protein